MTREQMIDEAVRREIRSWRYADPKITLSGWLRNGALDSISMDHILSNFRCIRAEQSA